MAGTREAQRRHRWIERRLLQRFRREQPELWAAWWADEQTEWETLRALSPVRVDTTHDDG